MIIENAIFVTLQIVRIHKIEEKIIMGKIALQNLLGFILKKIECIIRNLIMQLFR